MADVKITQLPQAPLPLSGDEVFPLVQNGVTVQTPVRNIGNVSTISVLRSIAPISGASTNLQGYYTVGDGGGGQFYGVTGAAAGTYVDNGGSIIVPTGGNGSAAWLRPRQENLNVREWGAVGNNVVDDTVSIQKAIDSLGSTGGQVYFPTGAYKITSTINLSVGKRLVGEHRYFSRIIGPGSRSGVNVITVTGSNTRIESLWIGGGAIGVKTVSNAVFFGSVSNCWITNNRIGMELLDCYIYQVSENYIQNNNFGMVIGNQSFELVVRNNIIDNNVNYKLADGTITTGGCGLFIYGTSGAIIENNTIEGNRHFYDPSLPPVGNPSDGAGVIICGYNQRTIFRNNWYETNGTLTNSVDVMMGNPEEAWSNALLPLVVPEEYLSIITTSTKFIFGTLQFDGEHHGFTQYGKTIRLYQAAQCTITISNGNYIGILNRFNIPILLYGASPDARVFITSQICEDTSGAGINVQMSQGVRNTPVYWLPFGTLSTTPPNNDLVTYDGVDLFTARMSLNQFIALSGATTNVVARAPAAGSASIYNGEVCAIGGTQGVRVSVVTGRPRLGASALLTIGQTYYLAALASPSAALSYNSAVTVNARDASGNTRIVKTATINTGEITLFSGDYVGYMAMPAATFEASGVLKGCVRLVIFDLDIVERPISSATDPTTYTGSSLWRWEVGDVVYNSSPVSGGTIGWVCTTAGTPGTWKTFGAIA
jgi:hypothetical protein